VLKLMMRPTWRRVPGSVDIFCHHQDIGTGIDDKMRIDDIGAGRMNRKPLIRDKRRIKGVVQAVGVVIHQDIHRPNSISHASKSRGMLAASARSASRNAACPP